MRAPSVSGASWKTSVSTVATAMAPRGSCTGAGAGLSSASTTNAFFCSAAFRAASDAASEDALTLAAAVSAAASRASARLRSSAGSPTGAGFCGASLLGGWTALAFDFGTPDCSTVAGSSRNASSVRLASFNVVCNWASASSAVFCSSAAALSSSYVASATAFSASAAKALGPAASVSYDASAAASALSNSARAVVTPWSASARAAPTAALEASKDSTVLSRNSALGCNTVLSSCSYVSIAASMALSRGSAAFWSSANGFVAVPSRMTQPTEHRKIFSSSST